MATPFSRTHVTHIKKTGRRRSRSVTSTRASLIGEDALGQSMRRKQFWAQLQMERQKQKSNSQNPDEENQEKQQEEGQRQPTVTRIARPRTTMSLRKQMSSTTIQIDEQDHEHQTQVIRIPRLDSTMSVKKHIPSAAYKNSNVNVFTTCKDSNLDSSKTYKGLFLDSSQISSNPFIASSANLMTKTDIFDQEFNLNDSKDHIRRNDVKDHGSIKISERGKSYAYGARKLPRKSSASFMAAIIAIIIALIAFAFGLTALILVLLLRSTVAASLGANSTALSSSSSASNGVMPASCSAYTTLNDPTRNVFAPGYALGCDNSATFFNQTSATWVRFIGSGGTTLPLTTPGMNNCGTEGTGWYFGTMLSSTGMVVNGTACFTWYTSVCRYSTSISVANCGSFYIYLLPPAPACMMRYCTI